MIIQGCGGLQLDFDHFGVTDGINYYKPLSFSLIRKLLRRKRHQNRADGKFIAINNWIIFFQKGGSYEPGRKNL